MQGAWIDAVRFRCPPNTFRECSEESIKTMTAETALGVGNQNEKKEAVCRGRRYENKFSQKTQLSAREIS
jgi:nitrogen regulatory protein PII